MRKESTVRRVEISDDWFPRAAEGDRVGALGSGSGSGFGSGFGSASGLRSGSRSPFEAAWGHGTVTPTPRVEREMNTEMGMGSMGVRAVPPSYFEAQFGSGSGLGLSDGVDRSSSQNSRSTRRSVGGTFAYSPVTGRYEYSHGGALRTSDMTSPVVPGVVVRGAVTGRLSHLQRLAR